MSKLEDKAEMMAQVIWLGSPEAGKCLPSDYLDAVACAIRLVYRQAAEIEHLTNEREEAIGVRDKVVLALEKARRLQYEKPGNDGIGMFIDEALSWI